MATNVNLDFSSAISGTVLDKDGQGTGFSSVQANTANNAYDLGRIDLNTSASSLVLTATQGSNASANTLKNGLQLPINSTESFTASTRLKGPFTNLTTTAQQGGIFLGSSQDNYVKLVISNASSGTNGLGLQFFQEQNGVRSSVGGGSAQQVTGLNWASINTLDLFLTGNPAAGTIKAAYRVNSDTATPISLTQQFTPNPTTPFFANETTARAGILAFSLNAPDVPVTFDNFSIQYAQPPAAGNGNIQVLTPDAGIVQNRMVFSTVNEEVRAAKTLTLRNTGSGPLTITGLSLGDSQEKDNAVRLVDHQRAADFRVAQNLTLPITLAANASIDLPVQFAPQRIASISNSTTYTLNGENYASLTITSDDPDQPTTKVNLAGVNFTDYEGNKEPTVAEIARIFGWTLNVGKQSLVLGGTKSLLGDEVYSPYWLRADTTKPVELWPLAVTSGRGDNPHGGVRFEAKPGSGGNSGLIYQFAGRNNDDSPTGTEVLGSNNLSGGENQKLLPKILVNNVNSVPTRDTVDFIPTKAFALYNGGSWTDDAKNFKIDPQTGTATPELHNWRMFPVRDAKGTLIPHTWYAIQDIGIVEGGPKNYDYNDHIYLLVNAKPESAALDPSVGGLFSGSPGLVFDFDKTYAGSLTDKDGQTIGFTSTQLNKNDTFITKTSFSPTLLDINTSGLGTLSVTSTTGSNGTSDNTLVNGMQTTFDGRASKSTLSTRLVGPLNNITTPVQQAGVMFGPDQDNFIKLVAIAQTGGTLGLQFYLEKKGVGTTIGSIVPISSPSTLDSLELMLLTDPQAGTVQAAYRAISAMGDTGILKLPNSVLLKGGQLGHFFAAQSKAGIITTSKGATTPMSVTFDRFAITSNQTTAARTALYRLDVGSSSNYTDTSGNVWTPDDGFFSPDTAMAENGGPTTPAPAIANTEDDTIYQTYRAFLGSNTIPVESRMLRYNLPASTPGKVDLRLHFAELYFGAPGRGPAGPDQRIFDISVEGVKVLDNLDITAASGGALSALVVPIEGIQVSDGVLNLQFEAEKNVAAISGIEVLR